MSTGQLHVIGWGHEERISEDFDQVLADAIRSTPDPNLAAAEHDDVILLTVLANFAGAGSYDPADPPGDQILAVLHVDPANLGLRSPLCDWWRGWASEPRDSASGAAISAKADW